MSTDRPKSAAAPTIATFMSLQTRWMDNDLYGHVNNVVYYSYFDTLLNRYLIDHGGLDIHARPGDRHRRRDALPLPQVVRLP